MPEIFRCLFRYVLACVLLLTLSACAQLGYYAQAMQGQLALRSSARPIDQWLADPKVADTLKERLKRVREIRAFAATELGLPDNGSYKKYADLKRSYVMWNVIAAPELSVEPKQWCFPVAGCVNYRGYYQQDAAQGFAQALQQSGFDVFVAGVPAYSTLGWFDDPVLSSFITYPDTELARLIFHELAHQVAYASGDSQFNESFATAVEEAGVARWLTLTGNEQQRGEYHLFQGRQQDFLTLLKSHRQQLQTLFASTLSDEEKRSQKQKIFQSLQEHYRILKQEKWAGYTGYDRWFNAPLSNAHLALAATYHDLAPAFQRLLAEKKTLPAFYQAVRQLARLNQQARHEQLMQRALSSGDVAPD